MKHKIRRTYFLKGRQIIAHGKWRPILQNKDELLKKQEMDYIFKRNKDGLLKKGE